MSFVKEPKDEQGRFVLRKLFFESATPEERETHEVPFTLKEHDYTYEGRNYISLRQLYLSELDPTEYKFAQAVFGSWDYWKRLKETSFFSPYYKEWRDELEIKLQSMGISRMMLEAVGQSKSAATAAKWLAERGWIPKESYKGRPSKAKIEQEAAKQRRAIDEAEELFNHAKTLQ